MGLAGHSLLSSEAARRRHETTQQVPCYRSEQGVLPRRLTSRCLGIESADQITSTASRYAGLTGTVCISGYRYNCSINVLLIRTENPCSLVWAFHFLLEAMRRSADVQIDGRPAPVICKGKES